MYTVQIKPLSVNECWKGRRFKTDAYKIYENAVLFMLPKKIEAFPPYSIKIEFGFSNSGADIDNPVKPFLDILQKRYGINDKDVYRLEILKTVVKKGSEFIKFKIE
ncbi:RusA family crossover junction endodeoxyribonuclease [Flavobacterium sp. HSC-61S13]|uniref:RusA family crossover junction endodeoxyribonuclease n=1 Tax=Flavobacterium sp. HSC-61S13 TaxID=2910963 RepID=UPI00209F3221|nr:RusA family crossover junction endodeoxyribonuclease [Flavobacterium sp. HSC-61S13]MCP1996675.1 Holliday junction resolvase RusA-like endonuclease [Flavobacterium sp. HSC-61S13]